MVVDGSPHFCGRGRICVEGLHQRISGRQALEKETSSGSAKCKAPCSRAADPTSPPPRSTPGPPRRRRPHHLPQAGPTFKAEESIKSVDTVLGNLRYPGPLLRLPLIGSLPSAIDRSCAIPLPAIAQESKLPRHRRRWPDSFQILVTAATGWIFGGASVALRRTSQVMSTTTQIPLPLRDIFANRINSFENSFGYITNFRCCQSPPPQVTHHYLEARAAIFQSFEA